MAAGSAIDLSVGSGMNRKLHPKGTMRMKLIADNEFAFKPGAESKRIEMAGYKG